MDISMHIINKFFYFLILTTFLAGCSGSSKWSGYDNKSITAPNQLYGTYMVDMYGKSDASHNIAVLLPTSGNRAAIGQAIRPAIEMATLQYAPRGLRVNFYDTGTGNVEETISEMLAKNPDVIIGPVFAENAKILRDMKPSGIPALSFTSDLSAVGDGILSVSLIPTNSTEAILQTMKSDGVERFIIMAPDNTSGHIMAGAAKATNSDYNIRNIGVFYYQEHDANSIKDTTLTASMYSARSAANTRAREILANIANNESLSATEKSSVVSQLGKLNKRDVIGKLPYDAILFLGTSDDTKSLVSFLRYYGVGANDVHMYGTSMWEGTDISSDVTMTGAKFATMNDIPQNISTTYESATGTPASRMAVIGYDAAILAINAAYADGGATSYLLNPSGYMGANGLFRLRPNGTNERALQIMRINGDGTTTLVKTAPSNFINQVYVNTSNYITPAESMELESNGINPMDYINIPDRLRGKYKSKRYGANTVIPPESTERVNNNSVIVQTGDDFSITAENYQPIQLENVSRKNIDAIEITE